jgi:transcriptional regulator with XRE-family HTH domain
MDERLQAEICARIRQARTEAGMTLEEMADALGVTQRAYWNYEHNRVPFRRLRDIAELTNVTQGFLLHGEVIPANEDAIRQVEARLAALEGSVTDGFEAVEAAIEQLAAGLQRPAGQ